MQIMLMFVYTCFSLSLSVSAFYLVRLPRYCAYDDDAAAAVVGIVITTI